MQVKNQPNGRAWVAQWVKEDSLSVKLNLKSYTFDPEIPILGIYSTEKKKKALE